MQSREWTEEQLSAINAKGAAILVSAAAGSGKTSVLVERLLRLISDRENDVSADEIAVVTFTNAAAWQLKKSLSVAISGRLEDEPGNAWLLRQQALLQTAKISTIHSFCFDLIRENSETLDFSAGFRILDAAEEKLIFDKALDAALERLYNEDAETAEFLCDFFPDSKNGDSEVIKTVSEIYAFLMSIPFYEDFLELSRMRLSGEISAGSGEFSEYYFNMIEEEFKKLNNSALYCVELFKENLTGAADIKAIRKEENALRILNEEADYFKALAKKASDPRSDWDGRIISEKIKFEILRFPDCDEESFQSEIKDTIQSVRQGYKKRYSEIYDRALFTRERAEDDCRLNLTALDGIIKIIAFLDREIYQIKVRKNALGFSDAEQMAVKLLGVKNGGEIKKTPLAKELSEFYKIIMIDEFQDANNAQDLIFKLISKNGNAARYGENVFAVGDIKQSIYRFRLANPLIFAGALKASEPYYQGTCAKNVKILLNKNFRSSQEAVSFVNFIFRNIMTPKTGEVSYSGEHELILGRQGTEYRPTRIILIPKSVSGAEAGTEEESGIESKDLEPDVTASEIKKLLENGTVTIDGVTRPCEPKDICILLRNKIKAREFIKSLEAKGIKAYTEDASGYLKSREVTAVINLLKIIDNPLLDIPLAGALMSPAFMFSAEDLAALRLLSEEKTDPLYKSILIALKDENAPPEEDAGRNAFIKKLRSFIETFDKLRVIAASQPVEKLIRIIYESADLLSAVSVYDDGERRKANLRILPEYARAYERSGGGLSGFIGFIDSMIARKSDFERPLAVSENQNAVAVKTIHKSKGLEFPFVFVCGWNFNFKDKERQLQKNLRMGLGFDIKSAARRKKYRSLPGAVISDINHKELLSEEMRLLYVALTRAKEQLFITLPADEKKLSAVFRRIAENGGLNDGFLSSARSAGDWLMACLLTLPAFEKAFRSPAETENLLRRPDKNAALPEIEFITPEPAPEEIKSAEFKRGEINYETVKKLEKLFSFKYDGKLTDVPSKLTITEIVFPRDEDSPLKRPDFAPAHSGLTAAEAGTAMHTFMQYADFAGAERDISAEAERLCDMGLISEPELDGLKFSELSEFFRSHAYSRIKSSLKLWREKKFLVKISEISLDGDLAAEYNDTGGMLQGIADCVFEEPDGLVLIDYKTDRVRDGAALVSRYGRQILLYSLALEKVLGKKVKESYLYSFSLGSEIPVK